MDIYGSRVLISICEFPAGRFKNLLGKLSSVLCGDLEGWDGGMGRREAEEGGDICILIADSRCCIAETNTTL